MTDKADSGWPFEESGDDFRADRIDITLERVGEATVATVEAESIDSANVGPFRQKLAALVTPGARVVLDINRVRFIDSTGIGALITCYKALAARKGSMKICGVTQPVRNLLELVRMNQILGVADSREEALAAFDD